LPISNATPLIYLARLGKLNLLKDLFGQIQVPPEVKTETVDRGKAKAYSDAYIIEQAINEGWLIEDQLTAENVEKSEALAQMTGIDTGEAQAMILARQRNEKTVLIDQSNARKVARQMGLNPRGTMFVILSAAKRKLVTKEEAKKMLETLIEENFYISAKIYSETLKTIDNL